MLLNMPEFLGAIWPFLVPLVHLLASGNGRNAFLGHVLFES